MVTSLGGMDIGVDKNGIDAAYSGTQKCVSCPPGLSPITMSPKAMEVLEKRKSPVVSWYLDLTMVRSYWGNERKYHHTAPVNMIYGLREALRLIAEEGLEARFARHLLNHKALVAGVEAMGLSMLVPEAERLPTLNTVVIPGRGRRSWACARLCCPNSVWKSAAVWVPWPARSGGSA